jgi:putative addiction module component (TIGR02574 family)
VLKSGVMERTAEQVLNEALELPERDRAEVAARLIESLDRANEENVDLAWAAEIERRCGDRDAGRTIASDWEDVRQRIEREIFSR